MSFGFSVSDITTLISLTKKACDGWRGAHAEFKDIVQTLGSFTILLEGLQHRFKDLETSPNVEKRKSDLSHVLQGCKDAVEELRSVWRRYKRMRQRDRLALGLRDTSGPKERLIRHNSLLTTFLMTLEFESLGKDVQLLPLMMERLPHIILSALPVALGQVLDARAADTGSIRSSAMTTYGDDDKEAYRDLRRSLRSLGLRDSDIRNQKHRLVAFMKSVASDAGAGVEVGRSEVDKSECVGKGTATSSRIETQVDNGQDAVQAEVQEKTVEDRKGPNQSISSHSKLRHAYAETEEEDADDQYCVAPQGSGIDGPLLETLVPTLPPPPLTAYHGEGRAGCSPVLGDVWTNDEDTAQDSSDNTSSGASSDLPATQSQTEQRDSLEPRSATPEYEAMKKSDCRQRILEYRPLDPAEDGSLIIQANLPQDLHFRTKKGLTKVVLFGRGLDYHQKLPLSPSYFSNEAYAYECRHGLTNDDTRFNSRYPPPFPSEFWRGPCGCKTLYWTFSLHRNNPDFLDDLREWAVTTSTAAGREFLKMAVENPFAPLESWPVNYYMYLR